MIKIIFHLSGTCTFQLVNGKNVTTTNISKLKELVYMYYYYGCKSIILNKTENCYTYAKLKYTTLMGKNIEYYVQTTEVPINNILLTLKINKKSNSVIKCFVENTWRTLYPVKDGLPNEYFLFYEDKYIRGYLIHNFKNKKYAKFREIQTFSIVNPSWINTDKQKYFITNKNICNDIVLDDFHIACSCAENILN